VTFFRPPFIDEMWYEQRCMPLTVTTVEHRLEDFGLPADAIELLWRMEELHFWHHSRNRWIERALRENGVIPPATILEVGCGSGAVATHLATSGYQVTGIDTAAPLVHKAHARCPSATFVIGDVTKLDAAPFDAIGLFDVLEHLDNPSAILGECGRLARPGALLVTTVPAQRALHTVIDDLSGHKRRYEVGELAALLAGAGLQDVDERGIFRLTVPMQKMLRRNAGHRDVSGLDDQEKRALWEANFRIPPRPLNWALRWLCALERGLGYSLARRRSGASLLATGRFPS
jgi:SAM-dependent methyltransferase